jgi:predicted Zn-dependent protease with MMP-like domain
MEPDARTQFDRLLDEVISELPDRLTRLLEEVPLVVDDRPGRALCERLGVGDPRWLCGLYTGIPLTRRSVLHSGTLPDRVQLFRDGIAGAARRRGRFSAGALKRQIRLTLLHEIGHHFGLGEAELRDLGYR